MSLIMEIQKDMELGETVELHTEHIFTKGLYTRKLHIPKGTFLIGKRHRFATLNILAKGVMTIYDEKQIFTVEAGFTAESKPFTKKAGLAKEDSIWINVFETEETDLDIIEELFIIKEDEYLALEKETECQYIS